MSSALTQSLETLRAMLGGSDYSAAEIYGVSRKTLLIGAEKKVVSELSTVDEFFVSLRVIKGGRLGVATTNKGDKEALRDLVLKCQEQLSLPSIDGINDKEENWGAVLFDGDTALGDLVDKTFSSLSTEEKMNRTLNLEANILKVDSRVKRSGGVSYKDVFQEEALWTLGSKKALNLTKTWGVLKATAVAEDGVKVQSVTEEREETQYLNFDWSAVARGAATLAVKLLGGRKVEAGRYAVCFSNLIAPFFVALLGEAFCADRVLKGRSFIASSGSDAWPELSAKTLFSDQVTLLDDPSQRKRMGYSPWDAEGSPPERLVLINKGRIGALAHNKQTARLFNTKTNGHAKRYMPEPSPKVGFHNLLIEPSSKDFVDLLRTMGKGIVLYKITILSKADTRSGELLFKADGMWVENGIEVYPVNDLILSLSPRDIFSKVVAVGRDLRWDGSVGAPSILCEGVSVAV